MVRDLGLRFKPDTEKWLVREADGSAYLPDMEVIASLLLCGRKTYPTGAAEKTILAACLKSYRALGVTQREQWLERAKFVFKVSLNDYFAVINAAQAAQRIKRKPAKATETKVIEEEKAERKARTQSMIRELKLIFSPAAEKWIVHETGQDVKVSAVKEIAALLLCGKESRPKGLTRHREIAACLKRFEGLEPDDQSQWLEKGKLAFRACVKCYHSDIKRAWKEWLKTAGGCRA